MRLVPVIIGPILLAPIMVAVLAACSAGQFNPPSLQGVDAAEVPNLAAMSDKVQDVFKSVKLTGYPRVSRVRQAPITAAADWMICLRSDAENDPRTYALFLQRSEVVDYRLALLIDQCAGETYAALPPAMPVK
jgi:hypothetical protein